MSDESADLLTKLREGEEGAEQALWDRYAERVRRVAHFQLGSMPRRATDSEDVVIDAFDSFCRRIRKRETADRKDTEGIWALLQRIAKCKAIDRFNHCKAQKRGEMKVGGESGFGMRDDVENLQGIDQVKDQRLSEEQIVILIDELQHHLANLDDRQQRHIIRLHIEGYSNREIARKIGTSEPTVSRKITNFRTILREEHEGVE